MTGILERVKPYLVYSGAVGTYQVRPLPYLLGNAPTVGQSLYVALMIILNVILTAVNYKTTQLFAWYANQYQEILAFVMYRTGTLAFALAPLVILFSSRNNILLWLSNWSHSTYLLLHRWVARIFGIQVLLHSILALALYIDTGSYPAEEKLPYWIWGAVGTVAVSIMLVASGLYVRRRSYEIFLITHIVLAVFVIVGCWYHVDLRFQRQWGYEMWLYAACAVWFFDRLARVLRILRTGVRRAKVADVGDGFVRVDVEGIRWGAAPGQHVYAYFPTLSPLRPWENHPFSVLPTAMLRSSNRSMSAKNSDLAAGIAHDDVEKHEGTTIRTRTVLDGITTAGLTLFIRKSTGMTKSLKAHDSLLTLLDGPYPNNPTKSVLRCGRLLLIGGGIGITGLLPWVNSHSNAKLCWSVKETAECLVQAMDGVLSGVSEKDVRVGRRLNIRALLSQEVHSGWAKIGVVACGPGGLCDDVRAAVAAAGKKERAIFELQVDAYSW
jgi:Ferric reductase like transmembrane component/FAD-binding domain